MSIYLIEALDGSYPTIPVGGARTLAEAAQFVYDAFTTAGENDKVSYRVSSLPTEITDLVRPLVRVYPDGTVVAWSSEAMDAFAPMIQRLQDATPRRSAVIHEEA